tara:strand:- start:555 stop:746 length:192 start_codon:yes stop_codon:yes gene_type:complete
MDGKLLTIRQVAQYLFGGDTDQLHKRAYRLIQSHDIEIVRSGRTIYVNKNKLDAELGLKEEAG